MLAGLDCGAVVSTVVSPQESAGSNPNEALYVWSSGSGVG